MDGTKLSITRAKQIAGTLSEPSKMPSYGYGIPAQACITGKKLAAQDNTVCSDCYALKGNYIFPNVKQSLTKRLESINHPQWIDAMVTLIASKHDRFFRWHDSGDLQSVDHLKKIAQIAERLPDTLFWLPTREYGIIRDYFDQGNTRPRNLIIRLSAHIVDGPAPIALARKYGLVASAVHQNQPLESAQVCPAQSQGNQCNGANVGGVDCRSCWDENTPLITYHKH